MAVALDLKRPICSTEHVRRDPVLFTIRATEEWRFVVESKVLPKGRLRFDYGTIKLALDFPHWYAQDAGVTVRVEVRDPDGNLLEAFEMEPSPQMDIIYGKKRDRTL
jgi:hypothetical protein